MDLKKFEIKTGGPGRQSLGDGGSRPAGRLPFVQAATKGSEKCLSLPGAFLSPGFEAFLRDPASDYGSTSWHRHVGGAVFRKGPSRRI